MSNFSERYLKTGGDPRTLPDYTALRDELAKLSHPARPDVNWRYAEKLCLSLFEQNGVELQTSAWYTLARMHLAGLFGLNEGLSILEALINHQWNTLWPQPVHARIEILSSLSQRLQQLMRAFVLNPGDLAELYIAEQQLTSLGTMLQRMELKHLSQLDTLRTLVHNSAIRLENSDAAPSSVNPPVRVMNQVTTFTDTLSGIPVAEHNVSANTMTWVYVVQSEQQPVTKIPIKPWKAYAAGMITMSVISAVTAWSWHYYHRPDPLQMQLATSLAPLPTLLTSAQLDRLGQQSSLPETLISDTQQQLTRLSQLPPDWALNYSHHLVKQAQALRPEQAKPLVQQWRQQLNAASMATDNLNGWHQGMTKLQQLSDRLSKLDEQKGKYITVSELKSAVFFTIQSFNQSIPAEEQLRVLSQNPAGEPLPAATKAQLEMHLKQLIARYAEIEQRALK